jgi:hypothetical protein
LWRPHNRKRGKGDIRERKKQEKIKEGEKGDIQKEGDMMLARERNKKKTKEREKGDIREGERERER